MPRLPSPLEIERIVALYGDPRPGVARLAMEALCAISGYRPPTSEPEEIVRRYVSPAYLYHKDREDEE